MDLPLDDASTLALVAEADTLGVFQMGKAGMRRMLSQLRADDFEDLPAAAALYRPGPLKSGMTRDYIERKHGRQSVVPMHPLMERIFAPTFQVCVYQEQTMAAVRAVTNCSLAQADVIRKIMGKKKPEMLAKERVKYLAAAGMAQAVDAATAQRVWEVVEASAAYSFNRSHSVAYGLLAYYTAYLKRHYPAEFYAAWMSTLVDEADKFKKLAEAAYDARAHGIEVLPPCVQRSGRDFAPAPPRQPESRGAVLYGLAGLRGLRAGCRARIIGERPFASLADFLVRAAPTSTDLASLAASGALATLVPDRAAILASVRALADWGARERKRRAPETPQKPEAPQKPEKPVKAQKPRKPRARKPSAPDPQLELHPAPPQTTETTEG